VQVLLLVDDDVRYDVAVHAAVKTMQLYERAQVSALYDALVPRVVSVGALGTQLSSIHTGVRDR
jgi:hypothetical protein